VTAIETAEFLPHRPQLVWRALTDPVLLGRWLMDNDFEPIVGHHFTFSTRPVPAQGFTGVIDCEVLELDPPRRLKISWASGHLDTTVEWRLEVEGRGTRLFLKHDGFDETDPVQAATLKTLGGGWRGHMVSRLRAVLEEDAARASARRR
jgi:uncharacterized protein YndB with AHSA1/START domain